MYSLKTDLPILEKDLADVVRLFTTDLDDEDYSVLFLYDDAPAGKVLVKINGTTYTFKKPVASGENTLKSKRVLIRKCMNCLYEALKAYFKTEMAWGSVTGIRPTKLVYDMITSGKTLDEAKAILKKDYYVSESKIELVSTIIDTQRPIYTRDSKDINFYIHIPLCPSRCKYCSFVATTIDKQAKFVTPYVDALCEEIRMSSIMIKNNSQKIKSVYIGGGTPTCLPDEEFKKVMDAVIKYVLPLGYKYMEFTCEAGRPDTIDNNKLEMMKGAGVTRVSVNPQSLNERTLVDIGRNHTISQFFESYARTKAFGFKINIDLIAGLSCENLYDFLYSLNQIKNLRPENITIHTLSRKRGSRLKDEEIQHFSSDVSEMSDKALEVLSAYGYKPYYLYKQKLMLDNLENVGYCLEGEQCENNITVMEEIMPVMACGAGAVSKLVFNKENRIERQGNIKDIKVYLERFEEQIEKKSIFFGKSYSKRK